MADTQGTTGSSCSSCVSLSWNWNAVLGLSNGTHYTPGSERSYGELLSRVC